MRQTATFSDDRVYRWILTRDWGEQPYRRLVAIGLNPSTADETHNDPTIRRLINFALREGLGGFTMVNLFAFRATDPKVMKQAQAPVGSDNNAAILNACAPEKPELAPVVVAAWGVHGTHLNRDTHVCELLHVHHVPVFHFGLTKGGHPKHPLYLPNTTPLTLWN